MKFPIPQEPTKRLLEDPRLLWLSSLYRHIKGDPEWLVPSLLNGWVNNPFGYGEAGYLLKNGVVYIKGAVSNGLTASGTDILTLPVNYRPAESHIFVNNSGGALGRFDINPDGTLKFYNGSSVIFPLQCSFIAEK